MIKVKFFVNGSSEENLLPERHNDCNLEDEDLKKLASQIEYKEVKLAYIPPLFSVLDIRDFVTISDDVVYLIEDLDYWYVITEITLTGYNSVTVELVNQNSDFLEEEKERHFGKNER